MFYDGKLIHRATVWPLQPGGVFGSAYGSPQHINCRWEDRQERKTDRSGSEFVSRALVMVDVDIPLGSRVAFGEYSSQPDAEGVVSYEVRAIETIPSVFGDITERSVWL